MLHALGLRQFAQCIGKQALVAAGTHPQHAGQGLARGIGTKCIDRRGQVRSRAQLRQCLFGGDQHHLGDVAALAQGVCD